MSRKSCKNVQNRLSIFLDGELMDREAEELHSHLESCESCAEHHRQLALLRQESRGLGGVSAPETLWPQINAALDQATGPAPSSHSRSWWKFVLSGGVRRFAGIAAVLFLGVLIGRYLLPWYTGEDPAGAAAEQSGELPKDMALRIGQHLSRTHVLFLTYLRADLPPAGAEDAFAIEKEISRVLLAENRELQAGLPPARAGRMNRLLGEIELVLSEIAHGGAGSPAEDLQLIRQGIENQDLLLQLRLEQLVNQRTATGRQRRGAL